MSTIKATKFYSVEEMADALDLTTGRIRQLIIAGAIHAEKPGRDHLIPEAEYRRQIKLQEENGKSNRGRPRQK